MLITRINQLKTLFILKVFLFLSHFKKNNKHWVICERGTDARDNGWHFYQYIKKHHPEIKVCYIIDKNSADYKKVREDAVQYGSLKNYWVVASAEKIISTHIGKCVPHLYGKPWIHSGLGSKFYFLQHGIIYNNLLSLYAEKAPMKMFICGAKPEYEYVKNNFGHKTGVVQYTGLARYDSLHNIETKKQILLMPTWRRHIKSREDFINSDYFHQWQSLIENPKLNAILQKNDYELIFYPHYEFQKYLDCFINNNSRIKIASFKDYDVQTLLKESSLLITDFSSVYFDFAYMKKPMIYYQFDSNKFFDASYRKGYFDYEKDGFGRVCLTIETVTDEIENCFLNNFALKKEYKKRIERFFPLYDKNNCQRIYEKITGR